MSSCYLKMDTIMKFVLLTILCACVGGARGACRHVINEDMVEYACVGGHPSDLEDLPLTTEKIRIKDMVLPRITADTFSRFGSGLWVLACSHCGIENIEPNAFERLSNLQQLSLDSNRLTTIKESWFRGLDSLTYLDLNYNNIESIEDGVFANLPSLVDVRLSGNRIECLNLEDMSHLKELKRIFLSENSELKCPNAISHFLEDRGVNFEKDPEWRRIPYDLIRAEVPSLYETRDRHTTPLPTFRERLHLVSSTTPPPEEPRTVYSPTRFYPTDEIFYTPDFVTPSWITTTEEDSTQSAYRERQTVPPTTQRSFYDDMRAPYVPQRTVSPPEIMTYPPYAATSHNLDRTTARSWPSIMESGSQTPQYPPRENENKHYEEPRYPSASTRPPFLASSPIYHQEPPSFAEPDVGRTVDPYRTNWLPDVDDVYAPTEYPVDGDDPDYSVPMTEMPVTIPTHVIRPLPPSPPEEIQPASPDDFFQAPYYDPTVTIRPPPRENYQQRQEETTLGVLSVETTTTDKPLPECPNRSSSLSIARSSQLIVVSVLLVVMKNVLVEGF